MLPEKHKFVYNRMQSLVQRPNGPAKGLNQWLRFVEHYHCEHLLDSVKIDRRLKLWCWLWAVKSIKDAWLKFPYGYNLALKYGLYHAKRVFPRLTHSKYRSMIDITWQLQVGEAAKMKLKRVRKWSAREDKALSLSRLNEAAQVLIKLRTMEKFRTLCCTRASNSAVKSHQINSKNYPHKVFICSASKGAGLAEHLPFLKTLFDEKVSNIVIPNKERLGRRGWAGVEGVLKNVGVKCLYENTKKRTAGHQSDKIFGLTSGMQLAGAVVLPAWLGLGELVGKVRVVGAESGRSIVGAINISPGIDWRTEHILLVLGVLGVRKPVRLLAPVDSKVGSRCQVLLKSATKQPVVNLQLIAI